VTRSRGPSWITSSRLPRRTPARNLLAGAIPRAEETLFAVHGMASKMLLSSDVELVSLVERMASGA
jgi:hypothetical protein